MTNKFNVVPFGEAYNVVSKDQVIAFIGYKSLLLPSVTIPEELDNNRTAKLLVEMKFKNWLFNSWRHGSIGSGSTEEEDQLAFEEWYLEREIYFIQDLLPRIPIKIVAVDLPVDSTGAVKINKETNTIIPTKVYYEFEETN